MNVYKSIMQGLNEAVDYQQGKIQPRKIKLTIKRVTFSNTNDKKSNCTINNTDKELWRHWRHN